LRIGIGNNQSMYWNGAYALGPGDASMAYQTRGVFSIQFSSGITVSTFKNGSQTTTATRAGTWSSSTAEFKFGRYDLAGGDRDGEMQEFVLWNSDQSANRAAIESNINSYYSIY